MIRTVAMKRPIELTRDIITGVIGYPSTGILFGRATNDVFEVKTWRDDSDILRTTKSVDDFGNKACYHDYMVADLAPQKTSEFITQCNLSRREIPWDSIPEWLIQSERYASACAILNRDAITDYAVCTDISGERSRYNGDFKHRYYGRVVSPGNATFDMNGTLLEIAQPFELDGTLYLLVMNAWSEWGSDGSWGRWWGYALHVQTMGKYYNPTWRESRIEPWEIGSYTKGGEYYCSPLSGTSRNRHLYITRRKNPLTNFFASQRPDIDSYWNRYLSEWDGGTSSNHPPGREFAKIYLAFYEVVQSVLAHLGKWWDKICEVIERSRLPEPKFSCQFRQGDPSWYSRYTLPYCYTVGCADSLPVLPRQSLRRFNELISFHRQHILMPDPPTPWNTLSGECVGQLKQLDINVVSFILELKDVSKSTRDLFGFLLKPKRDRKSLCKLWLSQRYGDRLTVSDAEEIFRSVADSFQAGFDNDIMSYRSTRRNQSRGALGHPYILEQIEDQFYKVYVEPKDYNTLMAGIRQLMDWGAWLDLANVWDMIPFSFVIDWFITVGDTLDSIDDMVHLMYYNIISVIRTRKVQTVLSPSMVKFPTDEHACFESMALTSLSHTHYRREVRATIDELLLQPITTTLPDLVNIIDGAALLLQR